MAISIEPAELLARRWADHTERAVKKFLFTDSTHQQISLALACIPMGAYTLTKRAGRALSLTLPGDLCELLGVQAGDRVVYFVTEHSRVELRRASLEDLPEYARPAAKLADRLMRRRAGCQHLKHFEKRCEQCERVYCARRSNQKFCPRCGLLRARACQREYERGKGRLTPSYQRKLKGARQAEVLAAQNDASCGLGASLDHHERARPRGTTPRAPRVALS